MAYREQSEFGSRTALIELDRETGQLRVTRKPNDPEELVIRLTKRDLDGGSGRTEFHPFFFLSFCMWLMSPCFPNHCPPDIEDVVRCLSDGPEHLRDLVQASHG